MNNHWKNCFIQVSGFLLSFSLMVAGQIRHFTITADNTFELYIDGQAEHNLPNRGDWTRADTIVLPSTTKLIAVKGTDHGVIAGILASTDDNYILSNSSWKCTSNFSLHWMDVSFSDSTWSYATEIELNGGGYRWNRIEGISPSATWIWTPNYKPNFPGWNRVIYCRIRLPLVDGQATNALINAAIAVCILLPIITIAVILLIVLFIRRSRKHLQRQKRKNRNADSRDFRKSENSERHPSNEYEELQDDLTTTNTYEELHL